MWRSLRSPWTATASRDGPAIPGPRLRPKKKKLHFNAMTGIEERSVFPDQCPVSPAAQFHVLRAARLRCPPGREFPALDPGGVLLICVSVSPFPVLCCHRGPHPISQPPPHFFPSFKRCVWCGGFPSAPSNPLGLFSGGSSSLIGGGTFPWHRRHQEFEIAFSRVICLGRSKAFCHKDGQLPIPPGSSPPPAPSPGEEGLPASETQVAGQRLRYSRRPPHF